MGYEIKIFFQHSIIPFFRPCNKKVEIHFLNP
jgi:hypothetical protein